MKSWVHDRRFAAGISALVLLSLSSIALAAVGRTVGTYQVSPTGAATYSIPIWAPRGPNGLQPNIALVYNSQQGSGYVGLGWSLAGISSIYRCNLTYAQDGNPAPVGLTTADGLCLDGQRLRLTSGTPDEAGSTYQTEIANFENVTAYGGAGNGPAYFVVQAPNGTQMEYGNGGSSQVLASGTSTAFQWFLDKVTDTAGNTMTFSYNAATGAVVPATISWTPTSYGATSYSYTMSFSYGTNAQTSSIYAYVAGTPVVNTNLLSAITIAYGGSTVKKYALTYQQSPTTSREELTQVEECADSAQTNCLAPTTITYQNGVAGTATSGTSALSSAAAYMVWNYDFNGDGRDDLAFCSSVSAGTVEVAFATGSGYEAPVNTGAPCPGALYGDLLGNGQDGIVANNGGTLYYYTWNGSSFAGVSTGVSYDSTAQYVLADVNGDGLADLIESKLTANSNLTIYARLNASSGVTVAFSSTNSPWFTDSDANITGASVTSNTDGGYGIGHLRRLDFNGDGRDDLELEIQDTIITHNAQHGETVLYELTHDELLAGQSGFTKKQIAFKSSGAYMPFVELAFIKFNSDACTDLLFPGDGSTTQNEIYVSGCDGSVPETLNFGPVPVIGAMDWNGDGLTDILVKNGSTFGVYESTGNGISSLISTSVPYSASNVYFTFDADGDGLDELGVWSQTSPYPVSYFLHNGDGQLPDLVSSVTDGYGNFVKPTYVSLAQAGSAVYSEGSEAQYPYENYIGTLYIVNQTTFSDPSNPLNGTYQQTDTYLGAWMNLQGRGFVGFEQVESHDSRNGLWDTLSFDREFPYTGLLDANNLTQDQARSTEVRYAYNNRTYSVLDSSPGEERYFVYFNNRTVQNYDASGGPLSTVSTNFSFDNYGNPTQIATTTTDNASESPFDGDSWTTTVNNTPDVDTGTWCLRLSSESQTSYTASDGSPSVTSTRDLTPDTTECRYTQIQTAPSSSYQVTEVLGYDSFGNINSDSVTGSGMAARVTSANWGTTGQFPMSVTDASGATTQFNYNFSYGLISSETDPNSSTSDPIVTSWQYGDGFGRLTQEKRPDGTYTTYAYDSCNSGNSYCGYPDLRLSLQMSFFGSDGSTLFWKAVYKNSVDAVRFQEAETLDGGEALTVNYYDALGRIVKSSMPTTPTDTEYDTTYGYDILNRLVQTQRPISQSDSTLETTTYAYTGDTTTITDPNENIRTLTRDANGWLRQTKDAMGYAVDLAYDAAGSKTSVTDSLGHTLWTGTYAYGTAPFLVGVSDIDMGAWGYTVDALGERTAWTDPKGQHFSESYDALSRPLTRTEPDLFTQWSWGSSAASHNIGRLASVCSGTGSTCSSSYYSESESYDSLGRPYQRSVVIPSMGTYTYTSLYNATTGLLDTLTYPTGSSGKALELKYAYQHGILQSITDILDSPNVTVWQANAEDPAGQITQETLGNGLVTNRAYDAVTGWLSSVQSGPGGGASIQNLSFLYDEVGNVTQRQDGIHSLSENIYYDNDYRLSYSTLGGTQNLSMSYDPMGNITQKSTVSNNAAWTYDSVHLHQVREAGSTSYEYTYDANGNMTSWAGEPITWASYNYPIKITGTSDTFTFAYAPDRSVWREIQTGGAAATTYRLGSPLMSIVVASSGTTDRNYIYAGNEPVAIDERTSTKNTFYYLLTDHQGSISGITNSNGQVVVNESFHPDGQRRNPNTWTDPIAGSDVTTIQGISARGYTFKETLESMNLIDFGGRVGDVFTGRFLSADQDITDPTNPQSYNRYSYAVNDPLTYTDPSGFDYVTDWMNGNGGLAINGGFGWQNVYTAPTSPSDDYSDLENFSTDLSATWHWDSSGGSDSDDSSGSADNQSGVNQGAGNFQPQSDPSQGNPYPQLQPVVVTAQAEPDDVGVSVSWVGTPAIINQSSGAFQGFAIYNVPQGSHGILLQQTTFGGKKPYYEAWVVDNGMVLDPGNITATSWVPGDINDVFSSPTATSISGQIQFYPNASLSSFPGLQPSQAGGLVPYAGDLPASWIEPGSWTSSGAIPHSITVTGGPGAYNISTCPPNC